MKEAEINLHLRILHPSTGGRRRSSHYQTKSATEDTPYMIRYKLNHALDDVLAVRRNFLHYRTRDTISH
ncbi:MAG: hypothetical protein ACREXO_04225, partial [Advenella sp.]